MRQNPTNRSDYNYFSKMNTRWNDNDIYGHLNNVIYYELFDTAVNKWLIQNNLINIKNGNNIGLIVNQDVITFLRLNIQMILTQA